ncbi:hypothetical protein TRVL_02007 [Trypanosoma vivax]|nr:hypothetical protein TRVL_02007 [Trypanosoma vivax]
MQVPAPPTDGRRRMVSMEGVSRCSRSATVAARQRGGAGASLPPRTACRFCREGKWHLPSKPSMRPRSESGRAFCHKPFCFGDVGQHHNGCSPRGCARRPEERKGQRSTGRLDGLLAPPRHVTRKNVQKLLCSNISDESGKQL